MKLASVCLFVVLGACKPQGPAPTPVAATISLVRPSIKADQVNVLGANVDGDVLTVGITPDVTLDNPMLLGSIGYKASRISEAFQKGVAEDRGQIKSLRFLVVSGATDRLGNESTVPLMTVTYSVDDLRAAHIDNLGPEQFLDLASRVFVGSAPGRKLIRAHCLLSDNRLYAPHFCSLAAG